MSAEPTPASSADLPRTEPATLRDLLDTLHDPAVRDLAWLLFSADLLRAQPPVGELATLFHTSDQLARTLRFLRLLDTAPEPLHRELAATRITRLGRYAERLLGWFLQHGPAARLVAAGVPLRRAGITLGECDFLLTTPEGAQLHWELAVKCYLHAGHADAHEASRLSDYVGPNLKDRFDLKLAHLLGHQLPLSAREEFASTGYPGTWTPQMFVKGWLFYRHGETAVDPVELDPGHGRGWWVTHRDWPQFASAQGGHWRVLPRLEWLAPRRHAAHERDALNTHFADAETLALHTSRQPVPTMVASFAEDSAGNLLERARGFIVPDDWPLRAQDYARQ
ncbi:hypothetical protein LMG22037_01580 [Paraburkholderia phenoliruptrix]|uniref:DUF1853 domain-containing protein n=1 Tax=Paraburkholderia phenoliruptrix TaxID=252970 RepID=A0A6J5ACF3_9BURK|nr:DUF1853 family protein [Paraburkholderia phenoliruptrix]CAB3663414.1 hypothetical protein LMG22037_01580 [Paraburkholderia phenoliruptrix]